MNTIRIFIIVPCFNEALNISLLLARLLPVVLGYDYRILFIDDGSTDETKSILVGLYKHNNRIKYISFSRNFGHQSALKAGYAYSVGADVVISLDGDLQHPPELIPEMIKLWNQGYKVVNTIRKSDKTLSFFKRKSSALFYTIYSFMTGNQLISGTADFRLTDRSVVKVINEMQETGPFMRGFISWMGFRQIGIEYTPANRTNGKSAYTLLKMINLAISGITSFGISPIRISFLAGTACSFLAFLYGVYAISVHLFTDGTVRGWTSVIASILFLSGFQLIMIGIIGEYIGKIHIQSRNRPDYIIEESKL